MNLHTKQDFQYVLKNLLKPLKPFYSENGAYVKVGTTLAWYDEISSYLEGFARPLWGLVPYWCGGGKESGFEEIYIKGIKNGTNPNSAEYWGECKDREQRLVEMTSLAFGIMFTPDKLWKPLGKNEKRNFSAWLYQINKHEVCDNNWRFFRVLVNLALKCVGEKYDAEKIESDLSKIDEYYLGNGWYRDGSRNIKDYYVSFAFHFYGLIYSIVDRESERAKKFRDRAMEFAKDFIYWFDDDGEGLPYGRSLIYRFAQVSFWGACLVAGIEPFPMPVMKGIIKRHLEKWLKSQMCNALGVLTIGYKYENYYMAENYNSPSSPYWAMKAFIFLMLPDDHEFWQVEAKELPKLNKLKIIKEADMLVSRHNGNVTAYPSGKLNNVVDTQKIYKYSKFAYSTLFGFNVPRGFLTLEESGCDNMLVFVYDGMVHIRRNTYEFEVKDDRVAIHWSPMKGIDVKTEVIPMDKGHKRCHKVISDIECEAYDFGFAVACRDIDNHISENGMVKNNFSFCAVKSDKGEPITISTVPNTNLFYQKTKISGIKYVIKKGENVFESKIFEEE